LHDGRARSFDEAIRLHGGEARGSRDEYVKLSNDDQRALHVYLASMRRYPQPRLSQ
jgi:CxxC motif-containing protein (DUF1111 family)